MDYSQQEKTNYFMTNLVQTQLVQFQELESQQVELDIRNYQKHIQAVKYFIVKQQHQVLQ